MPSSAAPRDPQRNEIKRVIVTDIADSIRFHAHDSADVCVPQFYLDEMVIRP
jgi:hypothetical protein